MRGWTHSVSQSQIVELPPIFLCMVRGGAALPCAVVAIARKIARPAGCVVGYKTHRIVMVGTKYFAQQTAAATALRNSCDRGIYTIRCVCDWVCYLYGISHSRNVVLCALELVCVFELLHRGLSLFGYSAHSIRTQNTICMYKYSGMNIYILGAQSWTSVKWHFNFRTIQLLARPSNTNRCFVYSLILEAHIKNDVEITYLQSP